MRTVKIETYPYKGEIYRIKEGVGMRDDESVCIYKGVLDLYKREDMLNNEMSTAKYIMYIPYTEKMVIPCKGDTASAIAHGEKISFDVDNAVYSQLGGVEVFLTRNSWGHGL